MNLIEGLQNEANRRRELLKEYEAIGSDGAFGAMFLRRAIRLAEKSIAGGDVLEMVAIYKLLSEEDIGWRLPEAARIITKQPKRFSGEPLVMRRLLI